MKDRHHYLPQFYLRKFCSREQRRLLWEYDKETSTIQASTPKKSGFAPGHHSFSKVGGTVDSDSIELRIKRDFEDPVPPLYDKIRNRKPLSDKEWVTFCFFAASMHVRVPNYIANTQAMLTKMFQRSFDIMKYHDAEFRNRCLKAGVPIEALESARVSSATRDAALTMSLATFGIPAKVFLQMHWEFLHAPADSVFVTGDNPVFYCDPAHRPRGFLQGVGLANKTIEVTFPLSRTICALATWQSDSPLHKSITSEVVDLVNLRTVSAALRFVYSSEKSDRLMGLVKKTKGSSPKKICS